MKLGLSAEAESALGLSAESESEFGLSSESESELGLTAESELEFGLSAMSESVFSDSGSLVDTRSREFEDQPKNFWLACLFTRTNISTVVMPEFERTSSNSYFRLLELFVVYETVREFKWLINISRMTGLKPD